MREQSVREIADSPEEIEKQMASWNTFQLLKEFEKSAKSWLSNWKRKLNSAYCYYYCYYRLILGGKGTDLHARPFGSRGQP